jgi:hypothetical protein
MRPLYPARQMGAFTLETLSDLIRTIKRVENDIIATFCANSSFCYRRGLFRRAIATVDRLRFARIAPDNLSRLSEGATKCVPHPLAVREARLARHDVDRIMTSIGYRPSSIMVPVTGSG